MKDYFGLFTKSLKSFAEDVRKLRTDIEALEREREDVLYAPMCRSDVVAALQGWADRRRAEQVSTLARAIAPLRVHANLCEDPHELDVHLRKNGLLSTQRADVRGFELDSAFAWLLGDQFMDSLRQAVKSMDWPGEEGLPLAERGAAVDKIDRRLERMRAEYDKLVAEAAQHGLQVE